MKTDGTYHVQGVEAHEIVDRQQWLDWRKADVTASDIGAVCGVSKWKSPLRLYAEKLGLIDGPEETKMMRRGRWFEPAALFALREVRPDWQIVSPTVYLRDPVLRIGATPDLAAIDPDRPGIGCVQVKVVAGNVWRSKWLLDPYDDSDEINHHAARVPLDYQLQTMVEARMMGASWQVVAALVIGEFRADLFILEVEMSDEAWARIRDEVAYFWRCVETRREPELRPDLDNGTLRDLYPHDDGWEEPLDLTGDNVARAAVDELRAVNADAKAAAARKEELNTILMSKMRERGFAICGPAKIRWKVQQRREYTVPAGESRVFRIDGNK